MLLIRRTSFIATGLWFEFESNGYAREGMLVGSYDFELKKVSSNFNSRLSGGLAGPISDRLSGADRFRTTRIAGGTGVRLQETTVGKTTGVREQSYMLEANLATSDCRFVRTVNWCF